MVRNYDPDRAVPDELRERILENGLRAPSGGFTQGWAFLTLEGDDRERYWRIAAEDADEKYVEWLTGLRRAPLLILAFAHKDAYLDRYAAADKGWDGPRRGSLAALPRRIGTSTPRWRCC